MNLRSIFSSSNQCARNLLWIVNYCLMHNTGTNFSSVLAFGGQGEGLLVKKVKKYWSNDKSLWLLFIIHKKLFFERRTMRVDMPFADPNFNLCRIPDHWLSLFMLIFHFRKYHKRQIVLRLNRINISCCLFSSDVTVAVSEIRALSTSYYMSYFT